MPLPLAIRVCQVTNIVNPPPGSSDQEPNAGTRGKGSDQRNALFEN